MKAKQDRKRIVAEYMADVGVDAFIPREFLEWLRGKPDHECYDLFFGKDEAEAAMAYREELVRKWVSGLRITVSYSEPSKIEVAGVTVRELPMFHSPVSGWRDGGGYRQTDADDPEHMRELARQGAIALASWVERYQGAANMLGVDVTACNAIIGALDAAGAEP